jgi:hypothetical protein
MLNTIKKFMRNGQIRQYFDAGDNASTTIDKDRSLEDLICYLFERVPGISITERNPLDAFGAEEIDVALWNEGEPFGFYFLPEIILVECKNRSDPVGSQDVAWFDCKLRDRGMLYRILAATNGVTGDSTLLTRARDIIAGALKDQRRIIVITRQEIEVLTHTNQLVTLIKEKLTQLAARRTSI